MLPMPKSNLLVVAAFGASKIALVLIAESANAGIAFRTTTINKLAFIHDLHVYRVRKEVAVEVIMKITRAGELYLRG